MKIINTNVLEREIELWCETYAQEYCKRGADYITYMAKLSIENFYNSYEPKYYIRTDDLRHNSYRYYYKNNGKDFYGGVRISSFDMQGYKNGCHPFPIAYRAWQEGYHGSYLGGIPIKTKPPIDILRERMSDQKFLTKLGNYAERKANSLNYKMLDIKG